jgi:hypothetical protein
MPRPVLRQACTNPSCFKPLIWWGVFFQHQTKCDAIFTGIDDGLRPIAPLSVGILGPWRPSLLPPSTRPTGLSPLPKRIGRTHHLRSTTISSPFTTAWTGSNNSLIPCQDSSPKPPAPPVKEEFVAAPHLPATWAVDLWGLG